MSSVPLARDQLWAVTSRTIVYAAIGAALYGSSGCSDSDTRDPERLRSGRPSRSCRSSATRSARSSGSSPASSATSSVDQITGYGAFTAWNWSIANGLAGLLAGIIPIAIGVRFGSNKIVTAAIVARRRDDHRLRLRLHRHLGLRDRPGHGPHRELHPGRHRRTSSRRSSSPRSSSAVWGPIQEQIGR